MQEKLCQDQAVSCCPPPALDYRGCGLHLFHSHHPPEKRMEVGILPPCVDLCGHFFNICTFYKQIHILGENITNTRL